WTRLKALPEEAGDHVHDGSGPGIDQKRIVPVTHPDIARRRIGQTIVPGIVDQIAAAVIARPQAPSDREGLIAPTVRIEVEAAVGQRPALMAVITPVVAVVVPPIAVPVMVAVAAMLGAERRLGTRTRRVADDRRTGLQHR